MSLLPPTERTKIHRVPKRGSYDSAVVHAILDEALVCHVAFLHRGEPFAIPTAFARVGELLFVHGAAASRMLGAVSDHPLCVTVTLLDGLVLARSAFHHSMNYRSVVILGRGHDVTDRDAKLTALAAFVDKISPNRSSDVRAPNDKELTATRVIAIDLTEASAKIRTGGPVDDEADLGVACWAGHVPLALQPSAPIRDGADHGHAAPRLARHFESDTHVAGR